MKRKLYVILAFLLALTCIVGLASCGCKHETYKDGKCSECGSECLHAKFTNNTCDACGYVCEHKAYKKGECKECGYKCAHEYTNGACTVCGYVCEHAEYTEGICNSCSMPCTHPHSTNGICDACGLACTHTSYRNGVCESCGALCNHASFTDGVCDHCGADCVHTFSNGVCTICDFVCLHESVGEDYECALCGEEVIPAIRVTFKNGSTGATFGIVNVPEFTPMDRAEVGTAITYRGKGIEKWYKDQAMTQEFDFGTAITAPITLYGVPSDRAGFNVDYEISDTGVLTFTGTGDMFDFTRANAVPWLNDELTETIKSVVVSEGITSISGFAFASLNITSISLPSTIERIGESAFQDSGITGVFTLNDGIKSIGRNAFFGTKFTAIVVPVSLESVGHAAFNESAISTVYYEGNALEYSLIAFDKNNEIFSTYATKLYLQQQKPIKAGPYWYYNTEDKPAPWCYSLTYAVINEGGAFNKNVHKVAGVDYVFIDEPVIGTSNINFRNNLRMSGRSFQQITPAIVAGQVISGNTVYACERGNIYSVDGNITGVVEDGVLSINLDNPNRTTAIWDIQDINDVAVYKVTSNNIEAAMSSIKSVVISKGITYIGRYVFAGMTGVDSIVIPASVTQIHMDAFYGCTKLVNIFYEGTTNIQIVDDDGHIVSGFNGTDANLYVNTIVNNAGVGSWWKTFTKDEVSKYVAWTLDSEGTLYIGGTPDMYDFATVEEAPWYSFKSEITAVVVREGVNSLGENMINGYANVTSLTLPATLKSIPASSISGTGALLNATAAADGCIYIDNHLIKAVNVNTETFITPQDTLSIAEGAFSDANVKKILVYSGVKHIHEGAFDGNTTLEKLYLQQLPTGIANVAPGYAECDDFEIWYYSVQEITEFENWQNYKWWKESAGQIVEINNEDLAQ